MPAVSSAATLCLLVPILANAWNWYCTHAANPSAWKKDVVLKFIYAAATCFVVHGIVSIVLSLPRVSELASLTWAGPGRHLFFLHGFVALALFGGIYYVLPRVLQVSWANQRWIQIHLLCTVAGAALLFVGLVLGGLIQGARMSDVNLSFVELARKMAPFVGLSSLGMLVLLFGQGLFLGNLALMLRDFCRSVCSTACGMICGNAAATAKGGSR
jgi:cytochrome c oxidase cbb3-type subunit 1